jgi:type I restriction enzyme S subunit
MARKMRDSGVEWIGEVPEGWEFFRAKRLFRKEQRPIRPEDEIVTAFRDGEVTLRKNRRLTGFTEATDYSHYQGIRKGDLVIHQMDAFAGCVGISDSDGMGSPILSVCTAKTDRVCIRYYSAIIRMMGLTGYISSLARGVRERSADFRFETFAKEYLPVPPLPEQRRIADYLDEKCAAIDGAVEELKCGIEDCKAWKKAIIFEAVTGKANVLAASACAIRRRNCYGGQVATADKKNAKVAKRQMRDSGIPWIGEIPEGWAVSRVKNECINLDSLREPISAENRENKQGLYDYYGASGIIDKIDDYNVDDTVLLIGEDGANLRMRNLPLVYKATGKFWVNNHAHILKPKEGRDYDFMAYALEAGDYNDFITGSAQPKLSQANLMAYPIVLPPISEQLVIADYLDEKCAAIDALVAEKEKLVADLEAYKKALIFELVTGKREVA